MNLLEHYITEVLSEKDCEDKPGYVEVHFMVNCYGSVREKKSVYPKAMWRNIKAKGYYMG